MLAQQVSPPSGGSCTARSTEPHAGRSMNDESLCHELAPSRSGVVWSSTVISPYSGCGLANGWYSNGPNQPANSTCCAGVMFWSRKNNTRCS
jgi:hypothetical protein